MRVKAPVAGLSCGGIIDTASGDKAHILKDLTGLEVGRKEGGKEKEKIEKKWRKNCNKSMGPDLMCCLVVWHPGCSWGL